MILDETAEFADAVALNTGGAGTYNVGDIMDLGSARNIGAGRTAFLCVQVDTTATSGGSATGQFQLVSDSTSSIATDGSQTIHAITDAIPKASLTAGFQVAIAIPPQMDVAYERYLGVQQVTGTAAFTAGKINAFITYDPPADFVAMPDATN